MSNIVELTAENFQSILIEQSPEQLIVVELYSPRDEAGKAMSHDLNTLASELGSAILLTRVNCDEQPEITQQFGVSSVPTLVLIQAGKPLDGLTGITPIAQIKELLFKYLPKPEDELLLKSSAILLDEAGDINQAYTFIKQAYELDPERIDVKLCYSEVLIKIGQLENAKTLLDSFALEDKNASYQRLISLLELADQAGQSPEITALEDKLAQSPDDKTVKLELAVSYSQASRSGDALELLFTILATDLNFDDAKKRYLDIIAALPDGDPLASAARRKLYSLLH
jgi:putative thioredoxin